jgi:hypothetical protein
MGFMWSNGSGLGERGTVHWTVDWGLWTGFDLDAHWGMALGMRQRR